MSQDRTFEDAFNLLCGKLIGEGIHRKVFECRIRPDLVVKVEDDSSVWRYFANAREMKFWDDHEHAPHISKWLAPCEYLSPDGRIMLQKRTTPLRPNEAPDKIPTFLTDTKRCNFGLLDGRFVCHDYATTILNPPMRLKKADWS